MRLSVAGRDTSHAALHNQAYTRFGDKHHKKGALDRRSLDLAKQARLISG
jgi:hypothetical protein